MSNTIIIPTEGVIANSGEFEFWDSDGEKWRGRSRYYHLDGDTLHFGGEVTAGPKGSEGLIVEVSGHIRNHHMTMQL